MAPANNSSQNQNDQTGSSRSQRINRISPIQAQKTTPLHHIPTPPSLTPPESRFSGKLLLVLFLFHILLSGAGIIYLLVRAISRNDFRPLVWFPPLLTSVITTLIFSLIWQVLFLHHPSLLLKPTFYLSSFLTFAIALLLLTTSSTSGEALGGAALIFAISQSLYACWVTPRMPHAAEILRQSLSAGPDSIAGILSTTTITLLIAGIWSCFWFSGATAAVSGHHVIFLLPLIVHLSWTMLVLRNVLHVTAARVVYLNLLYGIHDEQPFAAYLQAVASPTLLGRLCLGSALAAVLGLLRDSARGISLLVDGEEEFMFSCTSCYEGVAERLFSYGNGWGFVGMGVHGEGFSRASRDTWEMFERLGMVKLIDADLTSTVSLLSGVTCGAFCAIVSGSWTFAVHRRDTPAVSFFAFVLGYFMNRIVMAWPQGCVNAYHVAYAENPRNPRFDSTIPERINELQGSPV